MKVETVLLTKLIEACLNLSMDSAIPPAQRKEFLALAKRLRGTLMNLLTATFREGTPAVEAANKSVRSLDRTLSRKAAELTNLAETIAEIAALVGGLDDLLKLPVKFK